MENDKVKKVEISVQTLQDVLNFLSEKPYKEVAELITSIIQEVNSQPTNQQSVNQVEEPK